MGRAADIIPGGAECRGEPAPRADAPGRRVAALVIEPGAYGIVSAGSEAGRVLPTLTLSYG
jgi:hypothetical protein